MSMTKALFTILEYFDASDVQNLKVGYLFFSKIEPNHCCSLASVPFHSFSNVLINASSIFSNRLGLLTIWQGKRNLF